MKLPQCNAVGLCTPPDRYLCPLIADMSSDVMWYSGQSYPAIYRATRGLGLVKRLRCSYVFKQKYSFKGVGISGKFDQYFPVTDLRKTCCSHDHREPDHWPLTMLSLKFCRSFVNVEWSHRCYNLNVEEQFAAWITKRLSTKLRMHCWSRFNCSLALFTVFIARLATPMTKF